MHTTEQIKYMIGLLHDYADLEEEETLQPLNDDERINFIRDMRDAAAIISELSGVSDKS